MAITAEPNAFTTTPEPDHQGWLINNVVYHDNPRDLVGDAEFETIRLWRLFQGGMAPGFLPDGGGTLDQAAIMLDAFAILSAANDANKKGK